MYLPPFLSWKTWFCVSETSPASQTRQQEKKMEPGPSQTDSLLPTYASSTYTTQQACWGLSIVTGTQQGLQNYRLSSQFLMHKGGLAKLRLTSQQGVWLTPHTLPLNPLVRFWFVCLFLKSVSCDS